MGERPTSKILVEILANYYRGLDQDLPGETRKILKRRLEELKPEELTWYEQEMLPGKGFVIDSLQKVYIDSGRPSSWSGLPEGDAAASIIEGWASTAVASVAGTGEPVDGADLADKPPPAMPETVIATKETMETAAAATLITGAEAAQTDFTPAGKVEDTSISSAPPTRFVAPPMTPPAFAFEQGQGLEAAAADVQAEAGPPWWRRNLKWIIAGASAFVLVAAVTLVTVLLFLGGEKTIYTWSSSERIGQDLRVERYVEEKKNAGGSPYLFTVTFKLTNLGDGEIVVLEVEEDLPDIIARREGVTFVNEPDKKKDNLARAGWSTKKLGTDESFEISYSLPLQAEFSEPQLKEIEEQFDQSIIAFVRLPENKVACTNCSGSGNNACSACSAMGSVVCPGCAGAGTFSCTRCGGSGKGSCATCGGDGTAYRCNRCGTLVPGYYDNCTRCGNSWANCNTTSCPTCRGSGTASCSSCGGSGRMKCSTCGGGARVPCAACGGAGQTTCTGCGGAGQVPFTYGSGDLYGT